MKKIDYNHLTLEALKAIIERLDTSLEEYSEYLDDFIRFSLKYTPHQVEKAILKMADHIYYQKKYILSCISPELLHHAIAAHLAEDLCQKELNYRQKLLTEPISKTGCL